MRIGYANHILQISFSTDETRKLVPDPSWEPTSIKLAYFTITSPYSDVKIIESKRRPFVYCQILLVGLKVGTEYIVLTGSTEY